MEPKTHFTVVTVHGLTFPCCRECGALVLDGQAHVRYHQMLKLAFLGFEDDDLYPNRENDG